MRTIVVPIFAFCVLFALMGFLGMCSRELSTEKRHGEYLDCLNAGHEAEVCRPLLCEAPEDEATLSDEVEAVTQGRKDRK